MSDIAFQQLREQLIAHQGSGLWVVDENIHVQSIAGFRPPQGLVAVTNRVDVYQQLKIAGFSVQLNDFDLSIFMRDGCDQIYYRVSKEKPVVHHVINQAALMLPVGGRLFLAGYKNEGTKTYIDKAAKSLGTLVNKTLGGKTAMLAEVMRDDQPAAMLDDKCYRDMVSLTAESETTFYSKPGVYGWNKIDKGSAFLIEQLDVFMATIEGQAQRFADLGCGFGYLSVMASKRYPGFYSACDNNVAAVNCCQLNFQYHQVDGDVLLDDCAESMPSGFDVVLCNPPFHQGFDVESDLCRRFMAAAYRLLRAKGAGLFVVNAFIPVEKKAGSLFSKVETIANNGSFKLVAVYK